MRFVLTLIIFFAALPSWSQSLIISDIDDTLKLADVPSYTGSLPYAIDEFSHFTGLEYVLTKALGDNPGAQIFYVSKAPEWLMKTTHENFLTAVGFPSGTYIGRTDYDASVHKLMVIRALLDQYKPQRVLFLGDNGEQDPLVYAQIAQEYAGKGIEFTQYIHIVFVAADLWGTMAPMTPEQTGFVTSIELSADLVQKKWLSPTNYQWMLDNVLPNILREQPGGQVGEVAFPNFMNCDDINWKWDIPGLNEKIKTVCHLH